MPLLNTGVPAQSSSGGRRPKTMAELRREEIILRMRQQQLGAPAIPQEQPGFLSRTIDVLSGFNYAMAGAFEELQNDNGGAAALGRFFGELTSSAQSLPFGGFGLKAATSAFGIQDEIERAAQKETFGQVFEQMGMGTVTLADALPFLDGTYLEGAAKFINTRGSLGLMLDIAADPLTYITGGTSVAARKALLHSGNKFITRAGRKLINKEAAQIRKMGTKEFFKEVQESGADRFVSLKERLKTARKHGGPLDAKDAAGLTFRDTKLRSVLDQDIQQMAFDRVIAREGTKAVIDPGGLKFAGFVVPGTPGLGQKFSKPVIETMNKFDWGKEVLRGADAWGKAASKAVAGIFSDSERLVGLPPSMRMQAKMIIRKFRSNIPILQGRMMHRFDTSDFADYLRKGKDNGNAKQVIDAVDQGTIDKLTDPEMIKAAEDLKAFNKQMEGEMKAIGAFADVDEEVAYMQHFYTNTREEFTEVWNTYRGRVADISDKHEMRRQFATLAEAERVSAQLNEVTQAGRKMGMAIPEYPALKPNYDIDQIMGSYIQWVANTKARRLLSEELRNTFGTKLAKLNAEDTAHMFNVSMRPGMIDETSLNKITGFLFGKFSPLVSTASDAATRIRIAAHKKATEIPGGGRPGFTGSEYKPSADAFVLRDAAAKAEEFDILTEIAGGEVISVGTQAERMEKARRAAEPKYYRDGPPQIYGKEYAPIPGHALNPDDIDVMEAVLADAGKVGDDLSRNRKLAAEAHRKLLKPMSREESDFIIELRQGIGGEDAVKEYFRQVLTTLDGPPLIVDFMEKYGTTIKHSKNSSLKLDLSNLMPTLRKDLTGEVDDVLKKFGEAIPGKDKYVVRGGNVLYGKDQLIIPRLLADYIDNADKRLFQSADFPAMRTGLKYLDKANNYFKLANYPFFPASAFRDAYSNVIFSSFRIMWHAFNPALYKDSVAVMARLSGRKGSLTEKFGRAISGGGGGKIKSPTLSVSGESMQARAGSPFLKGLEYKTKTDLRSRTISIEARSADGRLVGEARFAQQADGSLYPKNVHTWGKGNKRKGLASHIYKETSRQTGRRIVRASDISSDGKAFRDAIGEVDEGARRISSEGFYAKGLGRYVTYDEVARQAEINNIPIHAQDVIEMTGDEAGNLRHTILGPTKNPVKKGLQTILKGRENIDNASRLALFVQGLKDGLSFEDAAEDVARFLFNYNEIPEVQRSVIRRAIPFATFTLKNIEFHARFMKKNPGAFINRLKPFRGRTEENDYMVKWKSEGLKVRLGSDGKTLTALTGIDMPLRNLDTLWRGDFRSTLRGIAGMVTPVVKAPVESAAGVDFFTGRTLNRQTSAGIGKVIEHFPSGVKNWMGYKKEMDDYGRPLYSFDGERFQLVFKSWVLSRVVSTTDRQFKQFAESNSFSKIAMDLLTGLRYEEINFSEQQRRILQVRINELHRSLVRRGEEAQFTRYFTPKGNKGADF